MTSPDKPMEEATLACDVCLKEIPASEARSEEAVDYVLHFCGLECYVAWKAAQIEKSAERRTEPQR